MTVMQETAALIAELARVTEAHAAHWTGKKCPACKGTGEDDSQDSGRVACKGCGGTGEWHATWKQRAEAAESALAVAHAAGTFREGVEAAAKVFDTRAEQYLATAMAAEAGSAVREGFLDHEMRAKAHAATIRALLPANKPTGGSDAG